MRPIGRWRHIVIVVLALCAALALGGCAFSETITQVVYDQAPTNEVAEDEQEMLQNTPEAEEENEELPQVKVDDDFNDKQDRSEDLPLYGEREGNMTDAPTAAPQQSTRETAQEIRSAATDRKNDNASNEQAASGFEDLDADWESVGETADDGGVESPGEEGDNPDEQGENQDEAGSGHNDRNKDNDVKVYTDYGDFPEIPEGVKHVTAVGQAAVIVSMLAGNDGETPLWGADADFVNNDQVRRVLAHRGVEQVRALWDGNGTQEGQLSQQALDQIVNSDADGDEVGVQVCFVMEGDDTFTEEQTQQLLEANIIPYVLPSMASASRIVNAVKIVGDVLEAGGNTQAGQRRDAYIQFHNELVSNLVDQNKGLAGGFDYNTGENVSSNARELYTLLVTDWDAGASYVDPNGYLQSGQGVAIAELGYEKHPASYYLSVGGVVNNAAAGSIWKNLSGRAAAVWQFTTSKASIAWKNWASIDRSKATYAPDVQGFDTALLWSAGAEAGLGTREFPAVIVSSQEQRDLMLTDAARENGLYHPYSVVTKGTFAVTSSVGFYNGGNLVDACIGTHGMGTVSTLNDGSTATLYDVYVNPQGLIGNWVDGSVESVLESAWVYKTFIAPDYDLDGTIRTFYRDFYGYEEMSDSEIAQILSGPAN